MAHRPHGSSQPPPVLVPLPTDRSPAFIQTLMRAASESASHNSGPTDPQQRQQHRLESSSPYLQQVPATVVTVASASATATPRRFSNASSTTAPPPPPRIQESQHQAHLPVIRLQQEATTASPLQGVPTATAAIALSGDNGPHDSSNRSSLDPPLPPRIQGPTSSSSSSSSSLSEKPLPPMPTVETTSSPAANVPSSTTQQQQQYPTEALSATTATSFALGEHYLSNGGNPNNGANDSMSSSRRSLDYAPPPYSFAAGDRGSTIITTGPPPPTEEQLFQVQELSPGPLGYSSSSSFSGTGSSTLSAVTAHHQSTQYICADPMHDQQYLLVGSGNALHSIDLTFSNHQQQQQKGGVSSNGGGGLAGGSVLGNVVRTHIQGLAFKEIHCLEDIGLVVVIAGRNSRVRCYDYDSINRLVAYGHSSQGRGRVVEGGKLGAVKNMIQLRVETAFLRGDDHQGNSNIPSDGPYSSPPSGMSGTAALNRGLRGTTAVPGGTQQQQQPLRQNRHQLTASVDRSLLSPPARSDSPGLPLESIRDDQDTTAVPSCATTNSSPPSATATTTNFKKHKQRPLSFGGLASLAQEHVMRKSTPKDQQQPDTYNSSNTKIPSATPTITGTATATNSSSTPSSPSSATASGVSFGGNIAGNVNNGSSNSGAAPTKSKRLSQMASYLSQAAVNSNMAAHLTNAQDAPSEEAVAWAWDFTKLKQTKDVLGLDFHYTTTTVFMTVVSKTAIDIYCRPRSTRGRKAPTPSGGSASNNSNGARTSYSGADPPGRSSISSISGGGMAMATSPDNNPHLHRDYSQDPYEWKSYKQFYHPEAPSFMTVVKGPTEVTDIILGKGPRACVVNVQDMSVTDLHRQETSSVIHGLSKKLGFRNSSLWHSFEKIPFDVPPHILFPAAAEAMYGNRERKETYSRPYSVYNSGHGSMAGNSGSGGGGGGGGSNHPSSASGGGNGGSGAPERRSRDNILQRPSDQQTIHQQELEEQEREEAAHALTLKLQNTQLQSAGGNNNNLGLPYNPNYRGSSASSPPSSTSSSNSSSSVALSGQQQSSKTTAPASTTVPAARTKTRMVTSDEVLNLAFSQRTTGQLFLATYGTQSRIVDLQGKPQSRVVLDWSEGAPGNGSSTGGGGSAPQKVEFLKTVHDIYAVGFEKSAIVVFSLTRAKKVKEITKRDLIQATARAQLAAVASANSSTPASGNASNSQQRFVYDGTQPHQYHQRPHLPQPPLPALGAASSPPPPPTGTTVPSSSTSSSLAATALALSNATSSSSSSSSTSSSAGIKFLGRDSIAEDSLGLFFSYSHPKHGVSICQLTVVPLLAPDELELVGYYP
ncbi:hypothetical protein EC991_004941 [Linnemannia zychae]|nr:hypothetical protein EC991_004941 [Linnemannia zychae]